MACRNIPLALAVQAVVGPQGAEAHHNEASGLVVDPVVLEAGRHPYCYTSYAVAVPSAAVGESNLRAPEAQRPLGEVVVLEKEAVGLPTPFLTDLLDWGH